MLRIDLGRVECLPSAFKLVDNVRKDSSPILLQCTDHAITAAMEYLAPYWSESTRETSGEILKIQVVEDNGYVAAQVEGVERDDEIISGTQLSLTQVMSQTWDIGWMRTKGDELYDLTLLREGRILVVVGRNGPPAYLAAARAIRNITVSGWLCSGAVQLHGAGLLLNGRGILLVGDRRSGKTTQVCNFLSKALGSFVSNDRILVFSDGTFCGLPVSVNVRESTKNYFEQLRNANAFQSVNPHSVSIDRPSEDVSYSPKDFADRFGCEIIPSARLTDIFYLNRSSENSKLYHELLDRDAVDDALISMTLSSVDQSQPFWRSPNHQSHSLPIGQAVNIWLINSGNLSIEETSECISSMLVQSDSSTDGRHKRPRRL